MIEIKQGWTGREACDQNDVRRLTSDINRYNKALEAALEERARIQASCQHNHVLFEGQNMTCEVCGAQVEK